MDGRPRDEEHVSEEVPFTELQLSVRQDIRASQRTFEGAYMRTAISELAYGLLILRLFDRVFLSVGTVYVAHALLMVLMAFYQRRHTERLLALHNTGMFVTSGNMMFLAGTIAISCHIVLLVLIVRLPEKEQQPWS